MMMKEKDEAEELDLSSAHAGDEKDENGGVALLAARTKDTATASGAVVCLIAGGRAINDCWNYLSTEKGKVYEVWCDGPAP